MTLKNEIIETARAMNTTGLNQGTSGNVSARRPDGEGMYITPSGLGYDAMGPGDIVAMDWSGEWQVDEEERKPSSEWRFHLDILRARPEFGAVVHAHPVHCTALAVHGHGIGPFHYMVALAGGRDVRCCGYATFGTQELSDLVIEAMEGRKACLMAHHGMLACGRDLAQALRLAVEVETLAAQYLAALQLGEPPELTDSQIGEAIAKFQAGYGYGSGKS